MIITDVFGEKIPFCDVARGQTGKPLSFIKGNPPLKKLGYTINMPKCLSNAQILDHFFLD